MSSFELAPVAIRKPKVYVAGPMALGDRAHNQRMAIEAAEVLLRAGAVPFVPQLNYAWGDLFEHTHDEWLSFDFEWLAVCQYLLRLPGRSKGADMEVRYANQAGIPVFVSLGLLVEVLTGSALLGDALQWQGPVMLP